MTLIFKYLYNDILLYLFQFLNDIDKINFSSCCTKLLSFRKHFMLDKIYPYDQVKNHLDIFNFKYIVYRANSREIPDRVTHLFFDDYFNESIKDCISMRTHAEPITLRCIPNTVTHMQFGVKFNQNIKDCIPDSVTNLQFGDNFNQSIKDCLSNGIKCIRFGYNFNQDIDQTFPDTVTDIHFGFHFNKPIKNNLPEKLEYLRFGNKVDHIIPGSIPDNVQILLLPHFFNDSIKNIIPKKLKLFNLDVILINLYQIIFLMELNLLDLDFYLIKKLNQGICQIL
ncbi:FNIP repeat-containing protein [Megavirus courdo7]|uniref:FNIP repeat-containing protein n=1 Tax=Megavirus courdo7 TaxID=1128135 RepID=H2EC16_9VIRU|nr:FNIP repeat-containing protein [Megavirus courdo7]